MIKIKNFLLFCSGVTIPIILRNACITEHDKYASIGAIILLTAILAVLSGGYALYSIFQSKILSGIFGLFWGAFIFTLDRLFVSSIKKDQNKTWKGQFLMAAPRIILALIISIVIARPLELKIFEKEIDGQRLQDIDTSYQKSLKDSSLKNENNNLKNELKNAKEKTKNFNLSVKKYLPNLSKSEFQEQLANYKQQEKDIQTQIINTQSSLDKLKQESRSQAEKTHPKTFLTQLSTLREMEENDEKIAWISFFLTSLFIVIETSPIMVKLLSDNGPYDQFLKAHEEIAPSITEDYKTQKISDEKEEIEAETKSNKAIRDNFYTLMKDEIEKLKDSLEKSEERKNALDRIVASLVMRIKKKFLDYYESISFPEFKQQFMKRRSEYESNGSSRNPNETHRDNGSSRNPQETHRDDGSSRNPQEPHSEDGSSRNPE